MPTTFNSWHDLPFREIWDVDAEFFPGRGTNNGGGEGDTITPFCLVALELRSGRLIRLRQGEFGLFPPYRLDPDALFIAYNNAAEFYVHSVLGWGQPACALDVYLEYRHLLNDGSIKSGGREKGFFGLDGLLRYFGEDGIDSAHKHDMRARIIQGPPFTREEYDDIVDYCELDVRKLARALNYIAPTIRSLPHAMFRAKVQWCMGRNEHRGIPVDLPKIDQVRTLWNPIKADLVRERDAFNLYETVNGVPHWRDARFEELVRRRRWIWPTTADGSLNQRDQTFREMAGRYPEVETIRELRYAISKLRLNDLSIGHDARARTLFWSYATKTGRCAPSTSKFIFGPAKWLRFFITPPPGRVLVHRDFCQQEVRIAAIKSGDLALLEACESGDVYLGIAKQLGFLRESMSVMEVATLRALFKVVVLSIIYGVGPLTLATRTGVSLFEACEILARLRARFRGFVAYAASILDQAGLDLEISTEYGWTMLCPPGINPRTVTNFPVQSCAAEVLHVACILAERRKLQTVATVHDAIMIEGPQDQAEELSLALDRVMRDASAIVLKGYELPTDLADQGGPIFPGQRFFDKRGSEMWSTITSLVQKLEERRA